MRLLQEAPPLHQGCPSEGTEGEISGMGAGTLPTRARIAGTNAGNASKQLTLQLGLQQLEVIRQRLQRLGSPVEVAVDA